MAIILSCLGKAALLAWVLPRLQGFTFAGKFLHAIVYVLGLLTVPLVGGTVTLMVYACAGGLKTSLALSIGMGVFLTLGNAAVLKLVLVRWFPGALEIETWKTAVVAGACLTLVDLAVQSVR